MKFLLSKYIYKYKILLIKAHCRASVEHQIILKKKIIVEMSGTPLQCPWVASLQEIGGGGRHHLGTIRGIISYIQISVQFPTAQKWYHM